MKDRIREATQRFKLGWHVLGGHPLAYKIDWDGGINVKSPKTWVISCYFHPPRSEFSLPSEPTITIPRFPDGSPLITTITRGRVS